MTSFFNTDTILIYVGDTLKEFMTAQAYASLHKLSAEEIRNALRANSQMKHDGKTLRPGISFR